MHSFIAAELVSNRRQQLLREATARRMATSVRRARRTRRDRS